jgi:hypothetical protein
MAACTVLVVTRDKWGAAQKALPLNMFTLRPLLKDGSLVPVDSSVIQRSDTLSDLQSKARKAKNFTSKIKCHISSNQRKIICAEKSCHALQIL